MPNHPYCLEVMLEQQLHELREIDRLAWKWTQAAPCKSGAFWLGILGLMGL
ncbi:hypothetical protein HQN90_21955 [Paenibacillus alba]|uniref:hypothetical protein n=1 Tax=Paenibacillus alba TaxID=1197127 RepID=UPI001562EE82|nr:hypothetical protein [Paenibacillus alba]NQX68794.1 hypothetical protein [Paenibacillus alba]